MIKLLKVYIPQRVSELVDLPSYKGRVQAAIAGLRKNDIYADISNNYEVSIIDVITPTPNLSLNLSSANSYLRRVF